MNERILELAEQAGSTHKQSLGVYQFYGHELEKFVELIVRECVGIIGNNVNQDEYWSRTTTAESILAIEEHFGVK